ncbi:MAG: hypothetical protein AB9903_10920 [Vulcanimicrobiota bacterium]
MPQRSGGVIPPRDRSDSPGLPDIIAPRAAAEESCTKAEKAGSMITGPAGALADIKISSVIKEFFIQNS